MHVSILLRRRARRRRNFFDIVRSQVIFLAFYSQTKRSLEIDFFLGTEDAGDEIIHMLLARIFYKNVVIAPKYLSGLPPSLVI